MDVCLTVESAFVNIQPAGGLGCGKLPIGTIASLYEDALYEDTISDPEITAVDINGYDCKVPETGSIEVEYRGALA